LAELRENRTISLDIEEERTGAKTASAHLNNSRGALGQLGDGEAEEEESEEREAQEPQVTTESAPVVVSADTTQSEEQETHPRQETVTETVAEVGSEEDSESEDMSKVAKGSDP
jgi:hypothetical protein